MLKLSAINTELVENMKEMSLQLDDLIEEEHQKNLQIQNKEILVKEKKCGHLPIIHDLETDIDKYDAEIEKALSKIDTLENGSKIGELASV